MVKTSKPRAERATFRLYFITGGKCNAQSVL
nr:MAG TPA: hypothetical protein [Caudoviricetes sp.]